MVVCCHLIPTVSVVLVFVWLFDNRASFHILELDFTYYLYLYKYKNICLFVCLFVCSRFSRPFRNRLGYPWHKVSFRWDSESEWDSGSESGSQTGSQSGSESGCELESEEESE